MITNLCRDHLKLRASCSIVLCPAAFKRFLLSSFGSYIVLGGENLKLTLLPYRSKESSTVTLTHVTSRAGAALTTAGARGPHRDRRTSVVQALPRQHQPKAPHQTVAAVHVGAMKALVISPVPTARRAWKVHRVWHLPLMSWPAPRGRDGFAGTRNR